MLHPLKVNSVPVSLIKTLKDHDDLPPAFAEHILHKLRNDTIGDLCCREKVLIRLGVIFYGRIKRKKDKKLQVRRSVRSDMRILAYLYSRFSKQKSVKIVHGDILDMFQRKNFQQLRLTIEEYTSNQDDTVKAGLKQSVYYF